MLVCGLVLYHTKKNNHLRSLLLLLQLLPVLLLLGLVPRLGLLLGQLGRVGLALVALLALGDAVPGVDVVERHADVVGDEGGQGEPHGQGDAGSAAGGGEDGWKASKDASKY